MKAAFYTLGCKTNQFETQALERALLERGFEIVPFEKTADVYIVNTCSVTAIADKKAIFAGDYEEITRRAKAFTDML